MGQPRYIFSCQHPYKGKAKVCKKCYQKNIYFGQAQDLKSKLRRRDSVLKYTYGIGLVDFEKMLIDQGGLCLICATKMNKPVVDHNHESEKVRGLLCSSCNIFVGFIENKGDLVHKINLYLADKK